MDELRASIVERLRSDPNRKLKRARNGGFEFRCPSPGHPDNKASAWIGEGGWKCQRCGASGNLRDLAHLIGMPVQSSGGYSLEEYADAKGFSASKLREWGLSTETVNGSSVLAVPYLDQDGKLLRRRFRGARSRRWWEGRNLPIYPYGLERLVDVVPGDPILVVEGESDCHAAWLGGFNAFGVPGATTWRSDWKGHLEGLDIYVWEAPDQGGASFSRSLAGEFPDAKLIQGAGVKDVAELYARADSEFGARLRALMADAQPIGSKAPLIAFDAILGPTLDRMAADKMRGVDATPTMLPSWNRACRGRGGGTGIGRGSHVVVGARTGTGKSIAAANLAVAAVRSGEAVCLLSLEMAQDENATRAISILSGVPIRELEHGHFEPDEWKRATQAMEAERERSGGVLWINREPMSKLQDVLDSIRYHHEVRGCRYFLIDYLQLARTAGPRNLFDQVMEVSHETRDLAKRLEVTTVGFSQLNREHCKLNEKPVVEGLYGGSALGNDADQVLLLDHSRVTRLPNNDVAGFAILVKNRGGFTLDDIGTYLEVSTLRLREAMPDELAAYDAP